MIAGLGILSSLIAVVVNILTGGTGGFVAPLSGCFAYFLVILAMKSKNVDYLKHFLMSKALIIAVMVFKYLFYVYIWIDLPQWYMYWWNQDLERMGKHMTSDQQKRYVERFLSFHLIFDAINIFVFLTIYCLVLKVYLHLKNLEQFQSANNECAHIVFERESNDNENESNQSE
ncbi:hypothetical protein Ddc_20218 [Ditylenchus destructor]|nr:hypothetical protein Ddc_20218 [Ditylenchus destructor]